MSFLKSTVVAALIGVSGAIDISSGSSFDRSSHLDVTSAHFGFLSAHGVQTVFSASNESATLEPSWAALNASVDGRLYAAEPYARPCFELSDTTGSFDQEACSAVQEKYLSSGAITSRFGGYVGSQWETCQSTSEQCALKWTNPSDPIAFEPPLTCSQGSVPPHYIEVRGPSDVQAAFAFSKDTGVPLVIKNTGHDYNGRSSGKGTLGLWTHNLKSMEYSENFVPHGCPASSGAPGATLGAGVQHEKVFAFADKMGITLPGGACPTVGAVGGYLMGGGHSWLSNIYGLAVDRVLEFEVVTPSGDHVFANACQNEDLYFALRGGGGGTFGVMLSATMKALPKGTYTTVQMDYKGDATSIPKYVSFLIANGVKWAEEGWSGRFAPASLLLLTKLGDDQDEAESLLGPLRSLAAEINGTIRVETTYSYMEWHDTFVHPNAHDTAGIPQTAASRLIPATTLQTNPEELLEAIMKLMSVSYVTYIFANAPYSVKTDPTLGEPSITPAWREAVWHVVGGSGWMYGTSADEQSDIYSGLTSSVDALRAISPNSGAYHNEADLHEPDFKNSFWGSNYERLVEIKQKYDPDRLLNCWHCIDSAEEDEAFKCYL